MAPTEHTIPNIHRVELRKVYRIMKHKLFPPMREKVEVIIKQESSILID